MQRIPDFIQATYEGENKGDYALKAKIAMEGLKDHPEEAEYIYAYTACFLQYAHQYEEAIEHCRKVLPMLTIRECKKDTYLMLVYSLEALGRFQEVVETRKEWMDQDEEDHRSGHLEDIAEAYQKMGDIENSIKYYVAYIEASNNICDLETFTTVADLYEKKGDYENVAKYTFLGARRECDDSVWLWINTGWALGKAGKEDEAKFYFEVALKIKPDDANAHYMMGQLYQNKKDHYRAMHHYMEALKTQPEFPAVYNNLGSLSFHEEGDIKAAIEYIEKALTMNPDKKLRTTLYLNLSRLYYKITDYEKNEYYKAKWAEELGFPAGFIGNLNLHKDEEDEDGFDEDVEDEGGDEE